MRIVRKNKPAVDCAAVIFVLLLLWSNFAAVRNTVYDFCVQTVKVKSLYSVRQYLTYETNHFRIKYSRKDADVVSLIANTIEKDYDTITQRLKHEWYQKVRIIIYPDLQTMRQKLHLSQNDRPMGIYYGDILHILSPKAWINNSNMKKMQKEFTSHGPMVHELIHLIVDQKTHGNYPLWFTEGIALYYEYQFTGYEWGKDIPYQYGHYTLSDLTYRFADLNQEAAYRKSFEIVRQIAEVHGEQKVLALMEQLGKGQIGMNSQITLESVVSGLIQ